jgi:sugar phosphate isomerase/epimerase
MRLGISSYTFVWAAGVPKFEQPRKPLTHAELLQKAIDLGIQVVQIADNMPLDRLSVKEIDRLLGQARDHNLSLEAGTCGFDPQHLFRYLDLAIQLRSPFLRVVMDAAGVHVTADQAVAVLREILPAFQQQNICLAIENHDRLRAKALAEIIERAGGEGVGICLDTANSLGCGEDVFTVLRTLAPWVVNVHLKDFVAKRLPHQKGFVIEGCPAGFGALNFPLLFDELRRLPHDVNAILELWPSPEDTIEASIAKEDAWAQQSVSFLRQYVAE